MRALLLLAAAAAVQAAVPGVADLHKAAAALEAAFTTGGLSRRAYAAALARLRQQGGNVTGLPTATEALLRRRSVVPEYTDPTLRRQVYDLQTEYAKVRHMPRQGRQRLAARLPAAAGAAVLAGLELDFREGSDTEILFRQESNFIYLTGFDHPGAKAIIGLDSDAKSSSPLRAGHCWLFVPRGDPVWVGRTETLDDYKAKYDVDDVFWIEDFERKFEEAAPQKVYTFANARVWGGGVPPPCAESADIDNTQLRSALAAARVVKTDDEIAFMRAVTNIAVREHQVMIRSVQCGDWESDAEAIFRYVGHNYGARFQSYIPIAGSGPRAAALHYNDQDHVIPDDSLVLVDAAAEIGAGGRKGGGYTSDVTRTWPCSGKFTEAQRYIYDAVFAAQDACVQLSVPGSSFAAATAEAHRQILKGLLAAGILHSGTVDDFYRAGIQHLFMPHGLGHSVGLDVHDPGNLSPFEHGMTITCEPGIYFYPSKLDPAYTNPTQGKYLNRTLIESTYINMGGVRIEDVVLITRDGPDNLSGALARTSAEIEALMAKGPPPRL
eukprot:TRINITY_DN18860_c0_g1_i1.p2 TRINITY_DN18860_c0_g1~~TRINITY_DN18860_c0_g1_i1.p2  ORF type:complete len:584 (+),score=219.08 TRINITY_DN18860_c0_g1_i1:100-1752(+)